ncbi:hypothetical protein LTR17_003478 [Elasticomyces elasticus]|nr:hypothetical protein LTR17_003478 [Elasticomyces elasticus]
MQLNFSCICHSTQHLVNKIEHQVKLGQVFQYNICNQVKQQSHEVNYACQPNEISVVHQLEQINIAIDLHIDVSLDVPLNIDLDKPQQLKELKDLKFDVPSIGDSPINNLVL